MKIIPSNKTKKSSDQSELKITISFEEKSKQIDKFNGFNFTQEEGLALQSRSYSEIPGLTDGLEDPEKIEKQASPTMQGASGTGS